MNKQELDEYIKNLFKSKRLEIDIVQSMGYGSDSDYISLGVYMDGELLQESSNTVSI